VGADRPSPDIMKKKQTAKRKIPASESKLPDWVLSDPPVPKQPLSKQDLDELTAGVKSGIRDTAAWKKLVRRVGKKEAGSILKLALFRQFAIQPEPNN
jgi:hypothetical protein